MRALRRCLTILGVAISSLLIVANPAAADVDVRHYVETTGNGTAVATCDGETCTLEVADPVVRDFRGPLTVVNGRASLKSPRTCESAGDSHGDLTMDISLSEELLTITTRQRKGEVRGDIICLWNPTEVTFAAQRLVSELEAATERRDPQSPTAAPGSASGSASAPAADRASGSTSRLASGEADAPSVLSALPTVGDVQARNALVGVLLAVILVLLVAFPTALLNSATETGTDRFSTWWRGRRGRASAAEGPDPRWWLAAGGVFLAGVISSFVDPGFGFNAGSLRTLLSVLASFGIDVVVGWAVTIWAVKRFAPSAAASYTFKPATLLLVVVAVVFTRATGFEPGIVFGLVAGVGFSALAGKAEEARAALVALGYAAVAGLLAWFAYGLMGEPSGVTSTFLSETLAATAIAGLAALPIALFPVPGMPGLTIFRWARGWWAATYASGLVAFFVVLMPTPYAWDEVDWSLRAWVVAYLAYLGVAITAWALVRRGIAPGDGDQSQAPLDRVSPQVPSESGSAS